MSEESLYYIWDKNTDIVSPATYEEWRMYWANIDNRRVGLDTVNRYEISTIFDGMPIDIKNGLFTFETIVFGWNREEVYRDSYSTGKEARDGHKRTVERVKNGNIRMGSVMSEEPEFDIWDQELDRIVSADDWTHKQRVAYLHDWEARTYKRDFVFDYEIVTYFNFDGFRTDIRIKGVLIESVYHMDPPDARVYHQMIVGQYRTNLSRNKE